MTLAIENEKVFITGACGFIGSHLVEELAERNAQVTALALYDARGSEGWLEDIPKSTRRKINIVSGDIRDTELMNNIIEDESVIFHLAALIGIPYSYHAPRSYLETNLTGTLNILEAARQKNSKRVVVMSTSEVYGSALEVPISESHPLQAQSPYSASKIAAEKIAESFYKSFKTPVTTVRAFNTFGPRQSARAVIPTMLMQMLNGTKEITLGDPTTTRDFNYVKDTVEGLIRIAESDMTAGEIINIGTGQEFSIEETVHMAAKAIGHTIKIKSDPDRMRPEKSEVRRLCADNSKLKELTGWIPPARLEEGLRLTAEWMKTRLSDYDPDRYYI